MSKLDSKYKYKRADKLPTVILYDKNFDPTTQELGRNASIIASSSNCNKSYNLKTIAPKPNSTFACPSSTTIN